MRNLFKRRYLVPVGDVFDLLRDKYLANDGGMTFFKWLEKNYGIKREWSWKTKINYLEFASREDYLLFVLQA